MIKPYTEVIYENRISDITTSNPYTDSKGQLVISLRDSGIVSYDKVQEKGLRRFIFLGEGHIPANWLIEQNCVIVNGTADGQQRMVTLQKKDKSNLNWLTLKAMGWLLVGVTTNEFVR